MAFTPLDILYKRAKYILRNEGWWAFVRQGFSFVRNLFFSYGDYYIYENKLSPADVEIKFKPKIDCTVKVVSSLDEWQELIARGCDFKALNFRPKLEKGAIAFCLFVGQELATVTWAAPNKEAKKEIDNLPFKVNFEAGEVCVGASFTDPAYRGKGLFAHVISHRRSYLASRGVLKDRFSIKANNIASQKATAKSNPIITSKGRYLKILWWESWKEQPVKEPEQ